MLATDLHAFTYLIDAATWRMNTSAAMQINSPVDSPPSAAPREAGSNSYFRSVGNFDISHTAAV